MSNSITSRIEAWDGGRMELSELLAELLDRRGVFHQVSLSMDASLICQLSESSDAGVLNVSTENLARKVASVARADRRAELEQFAATVLASAQEMNARGPKGSNSDASISIKPENILPKVRSAQYLDSTPGMREEMVWRHVAADLYFVFGEHLEDGKVRLIRVDDLPQLRLDLEGVAMLAFENLSKLIEHLKVADGDEMIVMQLGDEMGGELIAFADLIADIAKDLKPPLLVAVPASGVLLVGSGRSKSKIAAIRATVANMHANMSRPVSTSILEFKRDHYEVFSE
jgi:uncharacterized protein YtpQ (UPF0354 family)